MVYESNYYGVWLVYTGVSRISQRLLALYTLASLADPEAQSSVSHDCTCFYALVREF